MKIYQLCLASIVAVSLVSCSKSDYEIWTPRPTQMDTTGGGSGGSGGGSTGGGGTTGSGDLLVKVSQGGAVQATYSYTNRKLTGFSSATGTAGPSQFVFRRNAAGVLTSFVIKGGVSAPGGGAIDSTVTTYYYLSGTVPAYGIQRRYVATVVLEDSIAYTFASGRLTKMLTYSGSPGSPFSSDPGIEQLFAYDGSGNLTSNVGNFLMMGQRISGYTQTFEYTQANAKNALQGKSEPILVPVQLLQGPLLYSKMTMDLGSGTSSVNQITYSNFNAAGFPQSGQNLSQGQTTTGTFEYQ